MLAYLNGSFCPIEEARVSIEDRGFQFGDGVYEVIVTYAGKPFLLSDHMKRLRTSAGAIGLPYDFDGQPLEPIVEEGLRRTGLADAIVYIQLTRGAASRSHVYEDGMTPTVVMTFKPFESLPESLRENGVAVMTVPEMRWAKCFIKAITLLPNILAKNEAKHRGFFDAIFVTDKDEVRESTAANVFVVRNGAMRIPPRNESILHGITQGFIMKCAESINLPLEEGRVTLDDLLNADEVFLSSTTVEVLPVTRIDKTVVGSGQAGPVSLRMFEAFRARSRGDSLQSAPV